MSRSNRPRRDRRQSSFVARTPTDLVAIGPLVLGFRPQDSVVLLTFGGPRSFHARVDLPLAPEHQGQVATMLADAAVRNEVEATAVLLYTDDVAAAGAQAEALVAALLQRRLPVIDVLRVEEERWYPVPEDGDPGTPYDLAAHPFTAQRVFEGHVVHRDRDELAETLAGADPADRRAVLVVATGFAHGLRQRIGSCATKEDEAALLHGEACWLQGIVRDHVRSRAPLVVAEAARALVLLSQVQLRDVAWSELSRSNAEQHVELWRDLVRRAPDDLLPAPAALLAFSAWQAGDGALAWCAVDRCLAQDPDYSLAHLVGDALSGAVPPQTWSAVPAAELPVFRGGVPPPRLHAG